MKINWYKIVFIFLILLLFCASLLAFLFWQETQRFEPNLYYYVPPERSFIYTQEDLESFGIEEYIKERITVERAKLIKNKRSFIDLDLKGMKLALYKDGEVFDTFSVQSKGREGTWWETAPGVYFVGDKVVNHFSSIAKVWMPYGIQFYGNFFIHGWPYYSDGRLLSPGPSGGCVRLRTEDAAILFEFAERGMPVLVFDEKTISPLPALKMVNTEVPPPDIKSQAFLAADLETGEILMSKEIDSEIYAYSIAGGMMALAASEVVNLERRITAKEWMIEESKEGIIIPGRSYRAYDLLYSLLRQSSKEASLVLSRFFTPEYFLALMNVKAKAIGMNNTNFSDIIGISEKNITTLYDVAKMMRYIKDYRGFIFEITIPNRNLFVEKENLIGVFTAPRRNEKESLFTIWGMKTPNNIKRTIFIGVADSVDAEQDIENILFWLSKSFGLK